MSGTELRETETNFQQVDRKWLKTKDLNLLENWKIFRTFIVRFR